MTSEAEQQQTAPPPRWWASLQIGKQLLVRGQLDIYGVPSYDGEDSFRLVLTVTEAMDLEGTGGLHEYMSVHNDDKRGDDLEDEGDSDIDSDIEMVEEEKEDGDGDSEENGDDDDEDDDVHIDDDGEVVEVEEENEAENEADGSDSGSDVASFFADDDDDDDDSLSHHYDYCNNRDGDHSMSLQPSMDTGTVVDSESTQEQGKNNAGSLFSSSVDTNFREQTLPLRRLLLHRRTYHTNHSRIHRYSHIRHNHHQDRQRRPQRQPRPATVGTRAEIPTSPTVTTSMSAYSPMPSPTASWYYRKRTFDESDNESDYPLNSGDSDDDKPQRRCKYRRGHALSRLSSNQVEGLNHSLE
ncbi:hypothetical protein DFQ26_002162 [Actinomortierella ambigua]|nr:hypothetical protein DFQ26_002162 [Actinomortierella ambigua]